MAPDSEPSAIVITAGSDHGLSWGLGALAQLVHAEAAASTDHPDRTAVIPLVQLADRPRFPYRGLLLDTAHHGGPVDLLRRAAAVASACRLSVLHWHWSDTQAFQLELPSHPELAAVSPAGITTYSRADTRTVRDAAEAGNVLLLPELELPGHAGGGWAAAHPGLTAVGPRPGLVRQESPSGPSCEKTPCNSPVQSSHAIPHM